MLITYIFNNNVLNSKYFSKIYPTQQNKILNLKKQSTENRVIHTRNWKDIFKKNHFFALEYRKNMICRQKNDLYMQLCT